MPRIRLRHSSNGWFPIYKTHKILRTKYCKWIRVLVVVAVAGLFVFAIERRTMNKVVYSDSLRL